MRVSSELESVSATTAANTPAKSFPECQSTKMFAQEIQNGKCALNHCCQKNQRKNTDKEPSVDSVKDHAKFNDNIEDCDCN